MFSQDACLRQRNSEQNKFGIRICMYDFVKSFLGNRLADFPGPKTRLTTCDMWRCWARAHRRAVYWLVTRFQGRGKTGMPKLARRKRARTGGTQRTGPAAERFPSLIVTLDVMHNKLLELDGDSRLSGQANQGFRVRETGQGVLGVRTICAPEARPVGSSYVDSGPRCTPRQPLRSLSWGSQGPVQHSH